LVKIIKHRTQNVKNGARAASDPVEPIRLKEKEMSTIPALRAVEILCAAVCAVAILAGCGGGIAAAPGPGGGGFGSFDRSGEINVVSREDGSGTRGAFIELFGVEVKGEGFRKDMTVKEAVIANMTGIMLNNIAGDPYAVGYVSMGSLNEAVKTLDVDGAGAEPGNVKNGSYKIFRPFNIVVKDGLSAQAQDFIEYIMSEEGQTVVTDGYIAVNDGAPAYSGAKASGKTSGKIVVAGSSSVTPIMEKLREAYLAVNTGVEIEIQMSDSTSGINGAIEGVCDIGMASRSLKDSEKQALRDICIALDGIAVIVNRNNPCSAVTSDQVRQIYTGEITTWDFAS
jgi:phosphate transport system substrate-binding protein